ncbi:MAG: putative toxin-antitoxin system toxin component, PIN family [Anaerolineae bacterium]
MPGLQVVLDTNVLIAALRSPRGASYRVLQLLDKGFFDIHISVPLVLEYESVALRQLDDLPISRKHVEELLDYVCKVGFAHEIYYAWRPFLSDPDDDMVLEVAIASSSNAIVTFNKRDFRGCERFGVRLLTPAELLQEIGVLK